MKADTNSGQVTDAVVFLLFRCTLSGRSGFPGEAVAVTAAAVVSSGHAMAARHITARHRPSPIGRTTLTVPECGAQECPKFPAVLAPSPTTTARKPGR